MLLGQNRWKWGFWKWNLTALTANARVFTHIRAQIDIRECKDCASDLHVAFLMVPSLKLHTYKSVSSPRDDIRSLISHHRVTVGRCCATWHHGSRPHTAVDGARAWGTGDLKHLQQLLQEQSVWQCISNCASHLINRSTSNNIQGAGHGAERRCDQRHPLWKSHSCKVSQSHANQSINQSILRSINHIQPCAVHRHTELSLWRSFWHGQPKLLNLHCNLIR